MRSHGKRLNNKRLCCMSGATGCSWEQFPGGLGGNFGELGES